MTRWVDRAVVLLVVCGLAVTGCTSTAVEVPDRTSSDVTHTPADRDAPRPDAVEGPGSRAEPLPIGETFSTDQFSFTIDAYEADADATVEADFNDAPPPGYRYSIVTYTITSSMSEELYVSLIPVSLVTPDDDVIDERVAALIDEMAGTIAPGESKTGSRAFLVPKNTEVLISVSPGVPTTTAYYFQPS